MDQPDVMPGDIVTDIGCPLSQHMRTLGHAGPGVTPRRVCRVVKVFPWGLRVCAIDDPTDEWDCEHWERSR